jgi:uncharacterized membrane protein
MLRHILTGIGGRLLNVGRLPLCNQDARRAPHIGRFCFPLCWRCFGILFGILMGLYVLEPTMHINGHPILTMLLLMPCAVDGIAQRYFCFQSTTFRRISTGLLAGIASGLLL